MTVVGKLFEVFPGLGDLHFHGGLSVPFDGGYGASVPEAGNSSGCKIFAFSDEGVPFVGAS